MAALLVMHTVGGLRTSKSRSKIKKYGASSRVGRYYMNPLGIALRLFYLRLIHSDWMSIGE